MDTRYLLGLNILSAYHQKLPFPGTTFVAQTERLLHILAHLVGASHVYLRSPEENGNFRQSGEISVFAPGKSSVRFRRRFSPGPPCIVDSGDSDCIRTMKRRTAKGASSAMSTAAGNGGGSLKKAAKFERRLVKYEELPEYLMDNEFIKDYYRCEWPLKDVILSVFSLHNETLNIWTHLVGFMIFLGLMAMSLTEKMTKERLIINFFREGSDGWLKTKMMNQSDFSTPLFPDSYSGVSRHVPPSNTLPMWPWLVFLSGAMGCLAVSAASHLLACHSRRFYFLFWRLDYAGISLMIVSSFFAPVYYAFFDRPFYLLLYLSSITLLGVLATAALLAPALSAARFRPLRAALFLGMGFSGVVPAAHAAILHWDSHPSIRGSLGHEAVMGVLYGVGAVFYVTRVPERWRPGAFDVVGHSHQIFHVFVVAAAMVHCVATLDIMKWRRGLLGE